MSYTAFLTMCNDEKRAEFVLENFTKHNPEIPVIVYNGGNSASYLQDKFDIEYREGPNLWETFFPGTGSFSYEWFETIFEIGLTMETDHLIFLETDVLTTRRIESEPLYDISGPLVSCGPLEEHQSYLYWGKYVPWKDSKVEIQWNHKFHTGLGATCYKKNFFTRCLPNLKWVREAYKQIRFSCFQDVNISLLGRYSGCTLGDWSEATDTRGSVRIGSDKLYFEPCDMTKALIHNYKV